MSLHSAQWPADKMLAVEVVEYQGAWFVSYETTDGTRLRVLKPNGRPKGFRSLDALVPLLRVFCGVEKFGVTAQLRKHKP